MTERLKLESPGDHLTLTVANVASEDVGGFAYWKIGDADKEFVMPKKSLDAQIDRVGVGTAAEMIGKTVKFSRSTKLSQHGKPYWNIDLVANGTAPKPNPAKTPTPSHANVPNKDLPEFLRDAEAQENIELAAKVGVDLTGIQSKLAIYQGITEWYLANIPALYEKAKIGCSPESAAAGIHTLFITANK